IATAPPPGRPKLPAPRAPDPAVPAAPQVQAPPPAPEKVPPKFAAVTPLPITPAPLAADRSEITLPGSVAEACAGGGGRYFLLHLPSVRQLAVFDVSLGKVAKFLPLPADDVRFAAGMNKLLV